MKFQLLLTFALTTLVTIISGLPTGTTSSLTDALNTILDPLTKRSTLVCFSGLPAWVCESQYGASCSGPGEVFTPNYPDNGRSCTSRQCICTGD